MLLKDFFNRFPDDESCIDYFKDIRLSLGYDLPLSAVEPISNGIRKSYIPMLPPVAIGFPLTQGNNSMEKSHLPMYDWFFTANMMTSIKQVLSAKEDTTSVGKEILFSCMAHDDEV